ncbi:potassium transporter 4 isoform X2 [Ricinus communis]|uniref:potassium transporter 4 isoform X2 n=1 Tax=Ricinus communis TaxID=3988 RepID=UPI00201A4BAB|nr:potassium transporter 4 isoform X2 [Ricinus communis]
MEPESGLRSPSNPSQLSWVNLSRNLILAYQSFGVVYGDLSTSPLYVFTSTFAGKLRNHHNEEVIFGAFSLIFWTLTLIPLTKYVFILLSADDNGEGGTFALYSLLCRHAKFSLLPNQQAADEELSTYKYGPSGQSSGSHALKRFLEKHKRLRIALLVVVLFGACMVIGDGVLTPAISVLSSVSGLEVTETKLTKGELVLLACVILVGLFALQHCGTHRVAFMFAPIVIIWLLSIFSIGLYNILYWNPKIIRAISPYYIIKFFGVTGKDGWISLGGILLSITGLACMTVMFITTFLTSLVIIFVWQKTILLSASFLLFFWFIEGVYLSAALMKVPQGGWAPLVLSVIFMLIMYIWHYGTRKKYNFDLHNKVSLKWLLGLGPSLGIVRVPGIGLIYSELATGVPAIFSHFVTNLPAFHKVLVFVCVKSVPVPYVSPEERFLIGRVCPRPYRMYRCIVRYGYKDIQKDDGDFENKLIQSIAEFIQMEAVEPQFSSSESPSLDGRMAVMSTRSVQSSLSLIVTEADIISIDSIQSSKSLTLQSLRSAYDDDNPQIRRRQVRFQLPPNPAMDPSVREELMDLIEAKEAGVAYIMGHSYVKARRTSSFLKKLAIDMGYSFLRKNCRGPAVALNIPHISLIEVGMIYYV